MTANGQKSRCRKSGDQYPFFTLAFLFSVISGIYLQKIPAGTEQNYLSIRSDAI
jgi:hypothetical protein